MAVGPQSSDDEITGASLRYYRMDGQKLHFLKFSLRRIEKNFSWSRIWIFSFSRMILWIIFRITFRFNFNFLKNVHEIRHRWKLKRWTIAITSLHKKQFGKLQWFYSTDFSTYKPVLSVTSWEVLRPAVELPVAAGEMDAKSTVTHFCSNMLAKNSSYSLLLLLKAN